MRNTMLGIVLCLLICPAVYARDWFVRAGAEGGDGSLAKPFKDPYLAIEKAEAGDVIHVAKGVYTGKMESGNWVIAVPRLKLLGGYNETFTQRDPWTTPSELRFVKDSKTRSSSTILSGDMDHTDTLIDGFLIDQRERNAYAPEAYGDIDLVHSPKEVLMNFTSPGVQICNCLILNGNNDGIRFAGEGGRFENNIVVNVIGILFELRGSNQHKPTIIAHNTFCYAWSPHYGEGGPDGVGIKLVSGTTAKLADNVFQNCDNHGLFIDTKRDGVTLKNNIFWLNGFSNVKFYLEGRDIAIDNANMGDLDDAGFKSAEGNEVKDPGLPPVDPKWMEKFINRSAAERGKVKMDDWNKLRQIAGLPLVAEGGHGPSGYAMAFDATKALGMIPKIPQGAHPVKLEVPKFSDTVAVAKAYQRIEFSKLLADIPSFNGQSIEFVGTFGSEKSFYPFAGIEEKTWIGFEIYGTEPIPGRVPLAYIKRGTNADKVHAASFAWDGSGKPRTVYLFRGTVKADPDAAFAYKGTFLVDTVEPYVPEVAAVTRPPGRDWFVRAGASGGKGTKEKPFKDPWQALDLALPGDTIHVAEGEYFGKFKTGFWTIESRYMAMLGGYDKDFTERNPWKHPTRLGFAPDSKSNTKGSYIRGEFDHSAFILDGFVLDGKDVNEYNGDGSLLYDRSTRHALVELTSDNCVVRNCILLNGSLGAITMNGNGGIVENNIILNYHWLSVVFTPAGMSERPYVVRNNTILFTWYDRADGKKLGSEGSGIYSRAEIPMLIDNNIISFQDVCGIFNGSTPRLMRITNNVFSRNLSAHFADAKESIVLDDRTIGTGSDAGFAAWTGNVTVDPQLALDPAWMKAYLARTQTIPGKVTDDDWNKLRDMLGLPLKAEGGTFAQNYCFAYDWKKALSIFPKNPQVKAGAKIVDLPVQFNPNPPAMPEPKTYAAIEWPVIQNQVDTIDKKDVEFTGIFSDPKELGYLADAADADAWAGIEIYGPKKLDSGLPIVGYYHKDTRVERMIRHYEQNVPYKIRGIARKSDKFNRGILIIEEIEKAE